MWGDGIMILSGFTGLGVSKLWVKYLDQSGKSTRILKVIGSSEHDIT